MDGKDTLRDKYKLIAKQAFNEGIINPNQELYDWIRNHVKYDLENEYFVMLGVGIELADLIAKSQGFDSEVHRAYTVAKQNIKSRTGGKVFNRRAK